ncbi:MAG: ribose-5-phosphate isomerase [Opitutales bacterium]
MSDGAKPTISLGTDHAGFAYKEAVKAFLEGRGYMVKDCGAYSAERSDYPTYVIPAAEAVSRGEADLGIVFGGSGNGEAMAANKVKGIRCAVCWSHFTAEKAREHNDANCISIGARTVSESEALEIVQTWLEARFEEGRHLKRLELMAAYEQDRADP